MNLDHLRYFVKLSELRHYTRAAEQLCISQPSLSHAISQLESELGVPLFEKSGRNTVLTRYGEEFLECAQRSLGILDAGMESLQRSAKGEGVVRLGFLRTLGVDFIPKLTSDFIAADPNSGVEFSFHSDLSSGLIDGLLQHKFDLVFCSEPEKSLGLTATPVTSQKLVMIVPNGHPLADRESIGLAETLGYPAVWFAKGSGLRKVVDGMYEQVGGKPISVIETEEEALAFLARIRQKHKDATHNCYAYIIGLNSGIMRYSDDGEPGGTAGLPMMSVLQQRGVVNCCVVVTR